MGSVERWVAYTDASALLVIKHWHRQAGGVKALSSSGELQLHGLMLLRARGNHVKFVQGWRHSDGSFRYCLQQLLHKHKLDAK